MRLSNCGLTSGCLATVGEYVVNLEKIRAVTAQDKISSYKFKLDLSRNNIDDSGLIKIINQLKGRFSITSLNLDENYLLTAAGISKFFGCLDMCVSLEWLSLRELYIPVQAVQYLHRCLNRNIYLTTLAISFERTSLLELLARRRLEHSWSLA